MARRNEDYDWIFDFALQFLESDKFDAAVMDFVDEKCDVFTDDDENKLEYTVIHREFCEHIEYLISSNLGELGISNDLFLESCEKARDGRDINSTVFERLTAMDDFQTFKKIMAKRNTELQVESMRSMKVNTPLPATAKMSLFSTSKREGKDDNEYELLTPEEMRALIEADDMCNLNEMDEEDIQDMLLASLMEMEFMHRQEELEHLELERALTLSMMVEEERLRQLMAEAKMVEQEEDFQQARDAFRSEAKVPGTPSNTREDAAAGSKHSTPAGSKVESPPGADSKRSELGMGGVGPGSGLKAPPGPLAAVSEPKLAPLRELKPLSSKPLPSIASGAGALGVSGGLQGLAEKKRAAEAALRKGQEQLAEQRRQEEALRSQAISTGGLDAAEVERRAQHMRQQRELLIARKKAARDEKVQVEEERRAKKMGSDQEVLAESIERVERAKRQLGGAVGNGEDDKDGGALAEEVAEMRRANMRNALARRMKMDLIENEEAKLSQLQEDQFSELDQRLRQVEQLREDNRKRELMMNKQLERQQAQIARNVRMSAAELQEDL